MVVMKTVTVVTNIFTLFLVSLVMSYFKNFPRNPLSPPNSSDDANTAWDDYRLGYDREKKLFRVICFAELLSFPLVYMSEYILFIYLYIMYAYVHI